MIRKHWRELEFWRWFWRDRVRFEVKALLGILVLVAMLGGGWIAADRLSSANAGVSAQGFTFETTVQKVVTVREKGKIVRKLVPVVKRVVSKPVTAFQTLTDVHTDVVTTPGGVTTVQHKVVKLVPVVTKKVVTVNGKTQTVVTTHLVPTTNYQTTTLTQTQVQVQTQVQTDTRTQVQTQTATVTTQQTVTLPAVTITSTETDTVTGPTVTITVTTAGPTGPSGP